MGLGEMGGAHGAKESRKVPRAVSSRTCPAPRVAPGLWWCCWSHPALLGAGGGTREDWGLLALPSPCSMESGLCFHLEKHWVLAGADSGLSPSSWDIFIWLLMSLWKEFLGFWGDTATHSWTCLLSWEVSLRRLGVEPC